MQSLFYEKGKVKIDWWNKITEEERLAIDKGIADIKAGRVKRYQEVKKLYEKWLL